MYRLLIFGILLFFTSCNKDQLDFSSFESAIESGGDFDPVTVSYNESNSIYTEEINEATQELWSCTTTTVDIKDGIGGTGGFASFNPNAGIIFPGNLLQGKSLKQATPDEIPADRGPGSISINIINGNQTSSVAVDEVSLNSITDAANEIISSFNAESAIPASFDYKREVVQSEEEFALKIGADYSNSWLDLSGSLGFSTDGQYSRVMITLDQAFYTLTFTTPSSVDDFFHPDADPKDLERFIYPGNPPCYIKSVTYGRIFYMLIEATSNEKELELAVEAAFRTPVSEGGGNVDVDQFSKFSEVNVKIFAFGGDAQETLVTAKYDENSLDLINDHLVKATDIRTGLPISYVVKSVKTDETVQVQLATTYDIKDCDITSSAEPPAATAHWKDAIQLLGGPIGAIVDTDTEKRYLVNLEGTQVLYDDTEKLWGPFPLTSIGNGQFPLSSLGAGGLLGGSSAGGQVSNAFTMLINKVGNRYCILLGSQFGEEGPISQISDELPFAVDGISATSFYKSEAVNRGWLIIDNTGKKCAVLNFGTGSWFEFGIDEWGPKDDHPFQYEGVSAVSYIGEKTFAFINKEGTQYTIQKVNEDWKGPFKL